MAQTFTKSMARNIFYGGSVFFFLLFLALTFDTTLALPDRDRRELLDQSTELGVADQARQGTLGREQLYRLPHAAG
jgi:nitric oxide reductase subunit C